MHTCIMDSYCQIYYKSYQYQVRAYLTKFNALTPAIQCSGVTFCALNLQALVLMGT